MKLKQNSFKTVLFQFHFVVRAVYRKHMSASLDCRLQDAISLRNECCLSRGY